MNRITGKRQSKSRARKPLWIPVEMGGETYDTLNLDHPDVVAAVLSEINAGIEVYYDRRWAATEAFCRYLISHPTWVEGKSVLVLGAGMGMETLVIGSRCARLYVNDLAPVALAWCARQLRRNGIAHFELLPGRYEMLTIPPADLAVGCFVVYNAETAAAMRVFLDRCPYPVLLMNDPMPAFDRLVHGAVRPVRHLSAPDTRRGVVFDRLHA